MAQRSPSVNEQRTGMTPSTQGHFDSEFAEGMENVLRGNSQTQEADIPAENTLTDTNLGSQHPNSFEAENAKHAAFEDLLETGKKNADDAVKMLATIIQQKEGKIKSVCKTEEQEEDDKQQEADLMMWKSLEAKNFNFATQGGNGNQMAGRWARRLKADTQLRDDYSHVKGGNAAKAAFRKEWCKKEFDRYRETSSYFQEHSTKRQSEGTYYGLQRIAVEEGSAVSHKGSDIGPKT
jgi:hypothetical protein